MCKLWYTHFGVSTQVLEMPILVVFLLIKNENILTNLLLHILIQFHILVKITVIIQARNSYLCTFDICIDWAVQKSQTKLIWCMCSLDLVDEVC